MTGEPSRVEFTFQLLGKANAQSKTFPPKVSFLEKRKKKKKKGRIKKKKNKTKTDLPCLASMKMKFEL